MAKEEKVDQKPDIAIGDNIRDFGGNLSFIHLYRLAQNRETWRATAVQLKALPVQ